jgi:threonine dehydrogenase-like Zn-dependent dehydrogenase
MLDIGLLRDKKGIQSFDLMMPVIKAPDDVLVEVEQVGLDATDFNMVRLGLQDIGQGRNEIVLGHEMVSTVKAIGTRM